MEWCWFLHPGFNIWILEKVIKFFIEVCMIAIKSTKRIFEWKMLFYISCLLIPPACCSSQFMPDDDTVVCINVFSTQMLDAMQEVFIWHFYLYAWLQSLKLYFYWVPEINLHLFCCCLMLEILSNVFLLHRHPEGFFTSVSQRLIMTRMMLSLYLLPETFSLSFFSSPEAPPPPEPAWEEKQTSVIHLAGEDFRESLKKKKHTLVMFYAPCE